MSNCRHEHVTHDESDGALTCNGCGATSKANGEWSPSLELQLLKAAEDVFYPLAQQLNAEVTSIHNRQLPVVGIQGLTGSHPVDYVIQLLDGAITLLKALADKHEIPISRFETLALHEDFVSNDGIKWRAANGRERNSLDLFHLWKNGVLNIPSHLLKDR